MFFNICFCFFTWCSIGIKNSTIGLKICTITVGIKKFKLIIKKRRKKHYKIVLLVKTNLNIIEVLTS